MAIKAALCHPEPLLSVTVIPTSASSRPSSFRGGDYQGSVHVLSVFVWMLLGCAVGSVFGFVRASIVETPLL